MFPRLFAWFCILNLVLSVMAVEAAQIAVVDFIPENPTLDSLVSISWYQQKKAKHKPIWLRGFTPSEDKDTVKMSGILLFGFELNPICKSLKKFTREELQKLYDELNNNNIM